MTTRAVVSFAALPYLGREIYQLAPPIPDLVASSDGKALFTGDDLRRGQDVWRSIGGHELGLIWEHGAYTAPDWTTDWLHREAVWLAEYWSDRDHSVTFEALDDVSAATIRARHSPGKPDGHAPAGIASRCRSVVVAHHYLHAGPGELPVRRVGPGVFPVLLTLVLLRLVVLPAWSVMVVRQGCNGMFHHCNLVVGVTVLRGGEGNSDSLVPGVSSFTPLRGFIRVGMGPATGNQQTPSVCVSCLFEIAVADTDASQLHPSPDRMRRRRYT